MNVEQALRQAGTHLAAGRLEAAMTLLEGAARRAPDDANVHDQLGVCLARLGRLREAIVALREAARLSPSNGAIAAHLGTALSMSDERAEARAVAERAVELDPTNADAQLLLATLLMQDRAYDRADAHFRRTLLLRPDLKEAQVNYSGVLLETARPRAALELARAAARANPGDERVWSNYALASHYSGDADAAEIFAAHQQIGRILAARPALAGPLARPVAPDPEKRLRVGLLSGDLREHSVAWFLSGLLAARGASAVEYVAYSTGPVDDQVTPRIRGACAAWRDARGLSDAALLARIRADACDIVIELSGHTEGQRLSVLRSRAAPIQATWLGYPDTTGVPGIDVRLVDSITDPAGSEARATESLVRLDPCFVCYTPPDDAPERDPARATRDGVVFGSFNVVRKLSPATISLWSRVLRTIDGSRLVLKSLGLDSDIARRHILAGFAEHGVEPARIELRVRDVSRAAHLASYADLDIALDPTPYCGTTTTCEALWMGVPVVTLAGTIHCSRVGASLLSAVGLPELVATDPERFVEIAAGLAREVPRRRELSATLRDRMRGSVLCDERAFAGRMEDALRGLWRRYCSGQRGGGAR